MPGISISHLGSILLAIISSLIGTCFLNSVITRESLFTSVTAFEG